MISYEEVNYNADHLSVHVPLTNSTRNLINKDVMKMMKPGTYLINLTRDAVGNEKDLIEELTKGDRLRGAALDIHNSDIQSKTSSFKSFPNLILTPDIGVHTIDIQNEIGERVLETLEYVNAQLSPLEEGIINVPDSYLSKKRIRLIV